MTNVLTVRTLHAINSTGQDEQPLCEQGQGYNGYTVNYGSSPCGSHISGEYKASRRGTNDWKCSGQNIDTESGGADSDGEDVYASTTLFSPSLTRNMMNR